MPTLNLLNPLAQAMQKLQATQTRIAFEQNFSQLQKTAIGRLNEKIESVRDNKSAEVEIRLLQRDAKKLGQQLPALEQYAFQNEANQFLYGSLYDKLQSAITAFSSDDGDTNLTAAEVATINAAKDEAVEMLRRIRLTTHPDVEDPGVNLRIRNMADELEALTAVEGVVDASGTTPTTNDNRTLLDKLETLLSESITGEAISMDMKYMANRVSGRITTKIADVQEKISDVDREAYQKTAKEIDELKERTRIFMQSISVAFELQQEMVEKLGDNVAGVRPPAGTVFDVIG